MPIFIVAMLFAPMIAILPMEIEENKSELNNKIVIEELIPIEELEE